MIPDTTVRADDALDTAYRDFRRRYPAFETTLALDDLRATEYRRLDDQGHVYLDYTGGGLYADSQVRQHMELLTRGVYGNPHSSNCQSLCIIQCRAVRQRSVLVDMSKLVHENPDSIVAQLWMLPADLRNLVTSTNVIPDPVSTIL